MADNTEKHIQPAPNSEVAAKPARRTFTATYKLDILAQADRCTGHGQLGELLRREGLYSSHLSTWRQQRDAGGLQALGKKRGRKATPKNKESAQLRREVEALRRKLGRAEQIIEIQKKVALLLEIPLASVDDDGSL